MHPEHREIIRQFHEHYYYTGYAFGGTWKQTYWMGFFCWKCPLDLWIYQEILHQVRPEVIVEVGTAGGGTALFLADMCDIIGRGRVITIDIQDVVNPPLHPRISYLKGDSTSPEMLRQVRAGIGKNDPVLVILDSDHTMSHVLKELRAYSEMVTPGSYLIVEDTNINGHPVLPDFGPGPMEAVEAFLAENAEFAVDESREKFLLTQNPRGYLKKKADTKKTRIPAPIEAADRAATPITRSPRKVILKNFLSPGDILMLTAAVRDLHLTHPGEFLTDVRTSCPALWENNPYVTPIEDGDPDAEQIPCEYPLINSSNHLPYHVIHGFRLFLEEKLGVEIEPHAATGDVHISDVEKGWMSQVEETEGLGARFWIIASGGKFDFTAKWWDPDRAQQVVDHFRGRIRFVQCGESGHHHPRLKGVLDLVGKTDLRQLVRLMYHADGVVCPVTMFMHLAAAVETKPGRPRNRPCVVVAGGREPSQWEAYPHHQYLHTNAALPCCDDGGCWKSRVEPLGDGDEKDRSLCVRPVTLATGRKLPRCLDMITAADVIRAVEKYLEFDGGADGDGEGHLSVPAANGRIGEGRIVLP
jgi:cephalosporin hydroxylase/ADP-heptose:LPS heptosyltransferase